VKAVAAIRRTFVLPAPFGPTITLIPGSTATSIESNERKFSASKRVRIMAAQLW
jgi:hypothetical protein